MTYRQALSALNEAAYAARRAAKNDGSATAADVAQLNHIALTTDDIVDRQPSTSEAA